ncbi:hypothetical protein [Deinococcus marmoris]|uniref:hypothetical protein n=1 Tax=Deinococcus marmoris TaxID=249408 RepID=UPI000497E892|nr:hypothetical protein [Deinococcus marmoris]
MTLTLNDNSTAPSAVRNGAPRVDARGRRVRITPWLDRLGEQAVPVNGAQYARFLWVVAQGQAADLRDLGAALNAELREVSAPLLAREARLEARREALLEALHRPPTLSAAWAAQLQAAQTCAQAREERLVAAQDLLAGRLAEAGLAGRADLDLNADQITALGMETGAFQDIPHARPAALVSMGAALLMGPALYELMLRQAWLGLGLPESLDALGVVVAAVIGVFIAMTLKLVMEWLALHAGLRSGARHIRAAGDAARLDRFLRRHHAYALVAWLGLAALFAFIEGNIVASGFAALDPEARTQGGVSGLLPVIGALIALLPSAILGMLSGQRTARVLTGARLGAHARQNKREQHLARQDVRAALGDAARVEIALGNLERAESRLVAAQAEIQADRQMAQQLTQTELTAVQELLEGVQRDLAVLCADYGRRLEELHQRADQSAEEAMSAFRKQSGGAWTGLSGQLAGWLSARTGARP